MKKINVYNIEQLIKDNFEDKQIYRDKEMCVLIGTRGILYFDKEGVGCKRESIDEKVSIQLNDIPKKDGTIFVMPQYEIESTLKEITEEANYRACELVEFFDRYKYNERLSRNFYNLKKAIKEIGLEPTDYTVL